LKVDAETGKVTSFKVPDPDGYSRWTHGIKADQNGIIWLTLGEGGLGSLGRVDPKTGKYEIFTPPAGMARVGVTVDLDAKGKVWVGTGDGVLAFDPATEKFTQFKALTPGLYGYGVQGDADGNGWFGCTGVDIVGFADFKTGKVSEIPLTPRAGRDELLTVGDRKFYELAKPYHGTAIPPAQGPRRMGSGGKWGNYAWWPNWHGGSISKADIRTHEVSYYPLPIPNSHPYGTNVDKNGMVWVALFGDERVAKFDPTTQQWTLYGLPSLGNETRYITVDNHKEVPEVWVPSWRTSKVVRLQFRTKEQLQAVTK